MRSLVLSLLLCGVSVADMPQSVTQKNQFELLLEFDSRPAPPGATEWNPRRVVEPQTEVDWFHLGQTGEIKLYASNANGLRGPLLANNSGNANIAQLQGDTNVFVHGAMANQAPTTWFLITCSDPIAGGVSRTDFNLYWVTSKTQPFVDVSTTDLVEGDTVIATVKTLTPVAGTVSYTLQLERVGPNDWNTLDFGDDGFDSVVVQIPGGALASTTHSATAEIDDIGERTEQYKFVVTAPDAEDGDSLLVDIVGSGDINRDGRFDSNDQVIAMQSGLYNTGNPATFDQGDWDRDGVFDSGDFVDGFQRGWEDDSTW